MLSCEDCGWVAAGDARGWIAVRLEDDEGPVVLTYCPVCARQFDSDDEDADGLAKPAE